MYDATEVGGTRKAVPNLNTLLRYGGASAAAMADTNDLDMAIAARKDSVNPHLRYTDSEANGYGLAAFGADSATITLVTTERPIVDRGADGIKVRGQAVFELPLQGAGDEVALVDPKLSGATSRSRKAERKSKRPAARSNRAFVCRIGLSALARACRTIRTRTKRPNRSCAASTCRTGPSCRWVRRWHRARGRHGTRSAAGSARPALRRA